MAQETTPPDTPFVLRADPRDHLIAAAPVAPPRPLGLGASMRVATTSLIFTSLGFVAGSLLGMQLGLIYWQSFTMGAAAGYLIGWQSAYASLRKRYGLRVKQALSAPLVPTALILIALIVGISVRSHLGLPPITTDPHSSDWLNAGVITLIGYGLAILKMRKALRPAPAASA
jgi:hypothetical protein